MLKFNTASEYNAIHNQIDWCSLRSIKTEQRTKASESSGTARMLLDIYPKQKN